MTLRYDYAWQTPGWSAQQPTFEGPTDGYADPGMPEDVTHVHLYGSFTEFGSGRALESVLRLRVDRPLTHVPSGETVMGGALPVKRFTRYRPLSLWLPATDDPDLSPAFEYEATLTVRGQKFKFSFPLPMATPEVNINTLLDLR